MEAVFSDASRHLARYRSYIASECRLPASSAAYLTPDGYACRHTLYLLLYREIVRCQNGDVDDSSPETEALSIATYGLFRSVVALDGLIDADGGTREAHLALESLLHYEAAIRSLAGVVGSDPASTKTLRRLSRMCLSMYPRERETAAHGAGRSLRILFRKSSLVLMPIAWARRMHGPSERHATLRCGLIKLFVGMQILDDVRDYDEDVAAGQFTPYRAHVEHVLGTQDPGAACAAERRRELECMHLAAARTRLRSAMDAFRRAGSEALAQCVSLVHDEISRVLLLKGAQPALQDAHRHPAGADRDAGRRRQDRRRAGPAAPAGGVAMTRGYASRRRARWAASLALGACLAIAAADANANADAAVGTRAPAAQQTIVDMPAVQVKPRPEGPVLWEVRKDGRVLWVLAVPDALPPGLAWNWAGIDARLRQSGTLLGIPHVSTTFEVGLFRMFGVYRKARAARRNPGDRTLREILPPDDYARWTSLAGRYLGGDARDAEEMRPYFAVQELQGAQASRLGWSSSLPVWQHLGNIARDSRIPVVLPRHEIRITDPSNMISKFSNTPLQDLACFRAGLARVEQFPRDELQQANAWAEGDIAGMEASASEERWRQECESPLFSSAAARDLDRGSALDGKREAWLRAVRDALSAHGTAFALLPIDLALGADGYVSRLAGEGYEVSAQ